MVLYEGKSGRVGSKFLYSTMAGWFRWVRPWTDHVGDFEYPLESKSAFLMIVLGNKTDILLEFNYYTHIFKNYFTHVFATSFN